MAKFAKVEVLLDRSWLPSAFNSRENRIFRPIEVAFHVRECRATPAWFLFQRGERVTVLCSPRFDLFVDVLSMEFHIYFGLSIVRACSDSERMLDACEDERRPRRMKRSEGRQENGETFAFVLGFPFSKVRGTRTRQSSPREIRTARTGRYASVCQATDAGETNCLFRKQSFPLPISLPSFSTGILLCSP